MAEENVSSNAALYNKYRPSDFDSVYGQEDIVSSLSSAIEDGSLPHSFIFAGPRGTGKTSIARVVARALNCKNPVHGSPCGECESCRVPVSDAPGYYELDGASNAGVADARAIADEIRSGTSMADNRIFVIDEVQEMNSQAITALLKPLEEPPANTFIIFCTTDPERLPATIRSRGVTHYFNQVPDDKLTRLVIDTVEREGREPLDDETVQAVVMEGDGSPRDTLSVLQRVLMGGKAIMSETSVARSWLSQKQCQLVQRSMHCSLRPHLPYATSSSALTPRISCRLQGEKMLSLASATSRRQVSMPAQQSSQCLRLTG